MGDLDFLVRIKTELPDPKALLEAYGRSVAHGCFRVPAKLAAGRPFVLTFLTKSNVAAIKGTAEVIGHEGDATWVRFLSAADPRRDADLVLTHVKVTVVPSTVVTKATRGDDLAAGVGSDATLALGAHAARPAASRPGSQPGTRPGSRPGARPGSKVESAVADVPVPTAAGTGRSAALERTGPPDGRAPQRRPAAAAAGARDSSKAMPRRSLPAISTAPADRATESDGGAPATPRPSGDEPTTSLRRPGEAREVHGAHEAGAGHETGAGHEAGEVHGAYEVHGAHEVHEARNDRAPSVRRSAARPTAPALRRSADRQSGSAPAIVAARTRTGRRSAQHPAVRLVTPLASEPRPGGAPGSSENRTMPPAPEAAGAGAFKHAPVAPPHHLADPGYPMRVRTRGPSRPAAKQPRGLPAMPALAADGEREQRRSYPMHHVHSLLTSSPQLRSVPMASSSSPLPDEAPAAAAPRQESSGCMPLVSVVPWWTQPPERAAPRAPSLAPAAPGAQHASAEAAVDFAEASAPDLARPSAEALGAPYPRPPTMAEHAAPSTIVGDERSGRLAAPAAGAGVGALSAEAQLIEAARRSAFEEQADEPPAGRRVLWGLIAVAIICVGVAVGAVWWALDLRASAQAAQPRTAAPPAPGAAPAAASAPALASQPSSGQPSTPPSSSPPSSPSSPPPPTAGDLAGPGAGAAAAGAASSAPVSAAPPCQLRVTASANPAAVAIDGAPRGETPAVVEVPCGAVSLELRRPRYAPATRTVEAKPGITEVEVRLARPVVSVRILSRPVGVTVRLNGKDLGKTPLSAELPAFEHATLTWLASTGATETRRIYPQRDGDSFSATMRR